jgi:hypothetical protein
MVGTLQNPGAGWLCYYLVLGFVQYRQTLLSVSVGHVIKPDLSSEMEGHFKKQKAHLFSSFFPHFYPASIMGKKFKLKIMLMLYVG